MSRKFFNQRKNSFLAKLPSISLESVENKLSSQCKFNFAYFQRVPPGQDFQEWGDEKIYELLDKLVHFSNESLSYWMRQQSGRVFSVYGKFPVKSEFKHPKNVPIEAQWARFRLESATRLIGFVVPGELNGTTHSGTKMIFDSNTFYVVFLDENHQFYLTETR